MSTTSQGPEVNRELLAGPMPGILPDTEPVLSMSGEQDGEQAISRDARLEALRLRRFLARKQLWDSIVPHHIIRPIPAMTTSEAGQSSELRSS